MLFVIFCSVIFGVEAQVITNPPILTPTPTTPAPKAPTSQDKPGQDVWPGKYTPENNRSILADWLLNGCWQSGSEGTCKISDQRSTEYEGYDGWYNNIGTPDLGAIDRPLLRRWPAAYEDGTYLPAGSNRPNPIELSDKLLNGTIGSKSRTGKNALLVFFGQQVVEEILDAQRPACPPEYFNIKIPEYHKYRNKSHGPGHTELPLLRTRYDQKTGFNPNNPRQQLNEITPYIDGGLMYGTSKQWADQLRTYNNGVVDLDGLLAYSHGGLFPEYNTDRLPLANPPPPFHHADYIKVHETAPVSRFFKLGNPRGNENTFLLTFGVLWFRWHNYLAKGLRSHHSDWPSEKVFNEARKWVIATYQHIVVEEWLPSLINSPLPPYRKYDPSVNPQIDQFFQSAAFRFGHTLVVPGVYLRDYGRNNCTHTFPTWNHTAVRTCNVFWRPQDALKTRVHYDNNEFIDIDRVLMGMAVQLCEEEDHKIVEDLRGNVFGPLEFPRRDLMAINIQRGRDHGLPDFNTARKAYDLDPILNKSHFKYVTDEIKDELMKLYKGDINNIDPWVGGILETGDGPGELFKTVIIDQFQRIRDGDRFWYENTHNGLFTPKEIERIQSLTFYDVIMAVTKMDSDDIQRNPFRVPLNKSHITPKCPLETSTCSEETSPGHFNTFNCYHLPQLTAKLLKEECRQGQSYDYFSTSEIPFIASFSAVAAFLLGTVGVVFVLIKLKKGRDLQIILTLQDKVRNSFKHEKHIDKPVFTMQEWVGPKYPLRPVAVVLDSEIKQITVRTQRGDVLRVLDFTQVFSSINVYIISDQPYVLLRTLHNYDLVLKFDSNYLTQNFLSALRKFMNDVDCKTDENLNTINLTTALKTAITKDIRQKRLEMFFRVVFAQAFKIEHSKNELLTVDATSARDIVHTELTLYEFADSLNMKPESEFVIRMFTLIDKDKNGFISFREFVDLLIIFANGNEEQKAKLLFDMYDINAVGYLTVEDFTAMIKSFLETVGGKVEPHELQRTIANMMATAGIKNKKQLEFEDFKKIVGNDIKKLKDANLGFQGVQNANRNSFLSSARDTIETIYESAADIKERLQGQINISNESEIIDKEQEAQINTRVITKPGRLTALVRYIEKNSKQLFWASLYTLVLWAIFAERAYYYSVETEHSGLRRIAGYGVTVTRGAASAMMFTYATLLITMCRNTITYLRDTVFNNFIPFDASIEMHKFIAYWGLFFTIIHVIGHACNFYHISTQTASDLNCLFRNYFHSTHELPKFQYWCWETITGFTGVLLTMMMCVTYIFAQTYVRKHLYNWFWYTHSSYPVFYILMLLHGAGRLIQPPFFHYFFLGPLVLYILDTLVSISRNKIEIPIMKADVLPSSVTMLEFKKPQNFDYKSGQWVRIACLGLNPHEYHPFTLSSSPHEVNLTVHIRAVGPWTRNIRTLYDNTMLTNNLLPKIYFDGPYGEGHQDWYRYDVAVLIGGGIGVTPFASILKDIVFRSNVKNQSHCKKVYFIWVSRTQKQFEWLIDIIRELEKVDKNQTVSTHIFITQFYQKFDLRTILLYICERHYQKIADKSLFTNLRAVTHFGRPNFPQFFKSLQKLHTTSRTVGVFSCGPPSMTSSVENACIKLNKTTTAGPDFEHHFKNF